MSDDGRCETGRKTVLPSPTDGQNFVCVLCVCVCARRSAREKSNVSRESKVGPRMPPWLSMPQLLVPWEGLGRRSSVQKVGGRIFSYTSSSLGISAVWWREENEKIKKRGKEKEYFFFLFSNTESARLFSPHCYVRLLPTLRVYTLLRLGGGEAGLGNSQSPAHFFFPFFSSSSSFHLPKNPPSLLFTLCSTLGNFFDGETLRHPCPLHLTALNQTLKMYVYTVKREK